MNSVGVMYNAGWTRNLVPGDGRFDDATGYQLGENWAIAGGKAVRTAPASNYSNLHPLTPSSVKPGQLYALDVDVEQVTGNLTATLGNLSRVMPRGRPRWMTRALGTQLLYLQAVGANVSCQIDNLRCRARKGTL